MLSIYSFFNVVKLLSLNSSLGFSSEEDVKYSNLKVKDTLAINWSLS